MIMDMPARILQAALMLVCCSCSVKEVRDGCPCLLRLDLDEVVEGGVFTRAVTTMGPCTDRPIGQEMINVPVYEGIGYERSVPRRLVRASVVCGFKNSVFRSDTLRVGNDMPADPIMAFAVSRECAGETELVHVSLHKQFCRMTFDIEGEDDLSSYPFALRVRAACNGLNLYDLQPVDGEFSAIAQENPDGKLSLIVPRQKDNELSLELLDEDSLSRGEEVVVWTMDIGRKLASSGYDWNDPDLDDVTVRIDLSHVTFSLGVVPWDEYDYSNWEI